MQQIINFLSSNQGGITIFIVIIAGIWQYWRYIKEWNFKNYHKLIKELSQSDTPNENIRLDRQVAVVYELRNYPRYFAVSKRILQGWIKERKDIRTELNRLYDEMNLSIKFMDKNLIKRWWVKLIKNKQ